MPGPISIVIPAFNSEATIGVLIDRISAEAARRGWSHEIVVVNDGSTDATWRVLVEAVQRHDALVAVDLARNYGQHTALFCGLTRARGDMVVMMDDDLQHPPESIPALVDGIRAGHDAVFARFPVVRHPWWRSPGSALVRWTDHGIFGAPRSLFVSSFRAVRRDVVERVLAEGSPTPYLRGLIVGASRAPVNVDVPHGPRAAARSGYTPTKLASLLGRVVFSWSPTPVRVAAAGGALVAAGAAVSLVVLVGVRSLTGSGFGPSLVPLAWATLAGLVGTGITLVIEREYRRRGRRQAQPGWVVRQVVAARR